MSLTPGIYRVNTLLHDTVDGGTGWDIEGGSMSNYANCWLIHDNDTPAQQFYVSTVTINSVTYYQFKNVKSGKVLEAYAGRAISGGNVSQFNQWDTSSGNAVCQMWVLTEDGTTTINGTTYTLYKIANRKDTSVVMDCYGGSYTDMTNVWLYKDWGSDTSNNRAQRWIFHADCPHSDSIPTPSGCGLASASGGTIYQGTMWTHNASAYLPAFTCGGGGFQLRYRIAYRYKAKDAWTNWSDWTSLAGSTAELGWGDPWSEAFSSTTKSGIQYAPTAIVAGYDIATYDCARLQYEVRRFDATGHTYTMAVGGSALNGGTQKYQTCAWYPTITLSLVTFTPTGVQVAYASDWTRSGNKVTVESIYSGSTQICGSSTATGMDASDTIEIPFSELKNVPEEGASVTVKMTFETCDAAFSGYVLSGTVAYTASHGITLAPSYKVLDGYILQVTLSAYSTCSVWLESKRDGRTRYIECEHPTSTTYLCYPPLNTEYHIFIAAQKSDATWGTLYTAPTQMQCDYYVYNFDGKYALVKVNVGNTPSEQHNLERDSATVLPNGSDFEVTSFNHASKRPVTLSGALIHGDDNADVADAEALSTADYATFRTPMGWMADLAITNVQFTPHKPYDDVSITAKEQS